MHIRLTVQKDGPNKGRQFYGCPKGMNSTCNFFKWADENDIDNRGNTDWNNFTVNRGGNRTNSRVPQRGSAPKKPRLAGGKRKCGNCGIEGNAYRELIFLSNLLVFFFMEFLLYIVFFFT